MSQENVEIVRASIAAYNAADIDAQMATYPPTAVGITHVNRETRLPDLGDDRMEGREEIRRGCLTRHSPGAVGMRPRKFGRSATGACCAEAVWVGWASPQAASTYSPFSSAFTMA